MLTKPSRNTDSVVGSNFFIALLASLLVLVTNTNHEHVASPTRFDPGCRIAGVIFQVIALRTDARDLGNPSFSQKLFWIAVFFRQSDHLRIIERGQMATVDDLVLLSSLGRQLISSKIQVDVDVAKGYSLLSRPIFRWAEDSCAKS